MLKRVSEDSVKYHTLVIPCLFLQSKYRNVTEVNILPRLRAYSVSLPGCERPVATLFC